jgi:hypothetical protein
MLILIEADNPCIGLIIFVAVGMIEVLYREATVKLGDKA